MKKGLKWMAGLLTLAMVVGSFAGCGSSSSKETAAGESAAATTAESTADTASAETAGKKLKVALILPGKKDDVSFNQAMYEGMKKYADANPDKIDLNVTENVYEVADIEPALMDFADQGYDVIFGHGFQFMEPIVKVGAQYPDTYFLLGTGDRKSTRLNSSHLGKSRMPSSA